MHNLLQQTSLKKQFERRQKNFKANMHVQEDVELYRTDGYLQGYYQPYPPNPTNETEMQCFELRRWQHVVHADDSNCTPAPPPPRPPLLGRPRPPIAVPYECGDVYCYPQEQTTFDPGKVYNYRGDEWCENPLMPKVTYQQQSTDEFKNAGVDADNC